jgi:hypothetical protein
LSGSSYVTASAAPFARGVHVGESGPHATHSALTNRPSTTPARRAITPEHLQNAASSFVRQSRSRSLRAITPKPPHAVSCCWSALRRSAPRCRGSITPERLHNAIVSLLARQCRTSSRSIITLSVPTMQLLVPLDVRFAEQSLAVGEPFRPITHPFSNAFIVVCVLTHDTSVPLEPTSS